MVLKQRELTERLLDTMTGKQLTLQRRTAVLKKREWKKGRRELPGSPWAAFSRNDLQLAKLCLCIVLLSQERSQAAWLLL